MQEGRELAGTCAFHFNKIPFFIENKEMLCPEIWNFAVPKSAVTTKACTSENLIKVIGKQLINHHVSSLVARGIILTLI